MCCLGAGRQSRAIVMQRIFAARTLVPGAARGAPLRLDEPQSLTDLAGC